MYKNITLAIVAALFINVVGFNLYNNHVTKQFEHQTISTEILNNTLQDLKKDIIKLRTESVSSISRTEFDSARDSIEDTKRFIEYEVSMSKKSIQEFIDSLNKDMERLITISNLSQENDKYFQDKFEFLLNEIIAIQDGLTNVKEDLVEAPKVREVIESPTPDEKPNTTIESYPTKECSYSLNPGKQNSTRVIQRAVDRTKRKGHYNISVLFDVNIEGAADISDVVSNNAPSRLTGAVRKYVSKLEFVSKDSIQSNCEMSFSLSVT